MKKWMRIWTGIFLLFGMLAVMSVAGLRVFQRHQWRNEAQLAAEEAERERLEEALHADRQYLADVVWGTDAGTWEWNLQTGAIHVNERWAGLLGYTGGNQTILLSNHQAHDLAAALGTAAQQVEAQVGHLQGVVLWRAVAAPQQRAHTGEQLGEGKGLDQVVVGAGVQAVDAVAEPVACGQHQDGDVPLTALAQPTADRRTIGARQPDIEQNHIRRMRTHERQTLPTAGGSQRAVLVGGKDCRNKGAD